MKRPSRLFAALAFLATGLYLAVPAVAQPDPVTQALHEQLRDAIDREVTAVDAEVAGQTRDALAAVADTGDAAGQAVADRNQRPWLGLTARKSTDGELDIVGHGHGLTVTAVAVEGPAASAGLQAGDVLIQMNGRALHSRNDLRRALGSLRPGHEITLVAARGETTGQLSLQLGEWPDDGTDRTGQPATRGGWIGLHVSEVEGGLIVAGTSAGSPARDAGIIPGDVIVSINGRPASQTRDLHDAFSSLKIGDTMAFGIRRAADGDTVQTVEVEIRSRPRVSYDPRPRGMAPGASGLTEALMGRPDPEVARQLQQLNQRGVTLMREQKFEEAIPIFERMLEVMPDDETALYNLACSYSLMGELDTAVDYLEQAFLAGFTNWAHVDADPDLEPLHNHPKYIEMVEQRENFAYVQAEKRKDAVRGFLEEKGLDVSGYHWEVDRENMLIFGTSRTQEVLDQVKEDLLVYAEAQWKHLLSRRPKSYITILLPTMQHFRRLIPNRMIGGFYNPMARILVMPGLDKSLIHEFTHALHFADCMQLRQMHQPWFVEGLATCFEHSSLKEVELEDGTIDRVPTPMPNERLQHFQQALANGQQLALRDMLRRNQQQYMANAGICYAQSRYLVIWIWEQGKLKEFYDLYCETWEQDGTGITALTQVLGKDLNQIQQEFFAWARALPPFRGHTGLGGPYLGIHMQEGGGGIEIVGVGPDSPAERGGLQAGDVIRAIDGIRIVSEAKLLEVLDNHEVGDVIMVVIHRDGEETTLEIELGARPMPR